MKEVPFMHKYYEYTSAFAPSINDYIQSHRSAGFKFDNPAYWLYRFDQYCVEQNVKESALTKTLYDKWSERLPTETKVTQNNRLQALRGFSLYLNTMGIQSYIPLNLPRPEKIVPYLMTDHDIREFFEQVDLYKTVSSSGVFHRLSFEYKILFRLIYCCGLRNNEACTLKKEHVDLVHGSLVLHHTKGNKERIVYIPEDLNALCSEYLTWLNNEPGCGSSEWFFPGKDSNKHIPKTSIDRKFNEFWNNTAASKKCDKKPTVHCLRHAFVIKRVNLWMEQNISLKVMLPYLSNYLGHKGPIETFYYYHQVEDVFKTVRNKDLTSPFVIPEVTYED